MTDKEDVEKMEAEAEALKQKRLDEIDKEKDALTKQKEDDAAAEVERKEAREQKAFELHEEESKLKG